MLDVVCLTLDVCRLTLDVGRWTLDVGRWTLDVGRWTLDVGRWTLDVGPPKRTYRPRRLSSRFNMICSAETVEATPFAGTSIFEIHNSAFSTTFRKLSSAQFLWKWAPVIPKPRPPSGRS